MKAVLAALALAAVTAPFWSLDHALWEVDDARYAQVPREMHEGGAWLKPTLNGLPYVEKPPLIFWLGALSYRLFGVSEAAARLPLALLAVLGLAGTWWLGAWLHGPGVGLYAAVILGTCALYFGLSHFITPDLALSVFLLWSTAMTLRCLRRPKDGSWAGSLAWLALAAAFLSKGLIALVLTGAWTAALLLLFPELRRGFNALIANWGALLFLIIVGSWFAAMELNHPGFFHFFVVEEHFVRFFTPHYNRPGPWYFFLGIEAAGWMPWTPLVAAATVAPLARWRKGDSGDLQLALWAVGVLAFFTASSSKLLTYILPAFAHQAVLAASLLRRLHREPALDRGVRAAAWLVGGAFAVAAAGAPALLPRLRLLETLPQAVVPLTLAACAALAASQFHLACAPRDQRGGAVLAGTAALALCFLGLIARGSERLTEHLSLRPLAGELRQRLKALPPREKAPWIACYNIFLHGAAYYAGRPMDVINWIGELHYAKRFRRYAHRFHDDVAVERLPLKDRRSFVFIRVRDLEHFLSLPARPPKTLKRQGPWALAEFDLSHRPKRRRQR